MKYYYHYCTVDTFKKIVENDSLLFADPKKQNDLEEMKYFCTEIVPNINKNFENDFPYNYFIKDYFNTTPHIFIKCFSTDADSLIMWRGYTNNNDGIAIGFDIDSLIKDKKSIVKKKISYINKNNIDTKTNNEIMDFLKNIKKDDSLEYVDEILYKSLCYKSDFWKEEKEYRLVYRVNEKFANEDIGYFVKSDDMVCFYKITNINKYIKSITIGPKCKIKENEMKEYLELKGINGIVIETSKGKIS